MALRSGGSGGVHRDALKAAFAQWELPMPERRVGWQPSRFLTDRVEAERAYALAEQLGSVNAAATQLGTTWPSLRKAFTRHGLGMPTPNPEAVRQRAVAAARQRTGQPVAPPLDPVFVALNPHALPARPRTPTELYQWVRRDEEYATLGANVVVELNSESHARQPTTRAWAIIRRAERAHRHTRDRQGRGERRQADRATRSDRTSRSHQEEDRRVSRAGKVLVDKIDAQLLEVQKQGQVVGFGVAFTMDGRFHRRNERSITTYLLYIQDIARLISELLDATTDADPAWRTRYSASSAWR